MLLQLNDHEPRKGKKIGVTISFNNHRLFVGNIPKNRDRDELLEEFNKHARKRVLLRIEIDTAGGLRCNESMSVQGQLLSDRYLGIANL